MSEDLRSQLAIARDEWFASPAGKCVLAGTAVGNRIEQAFCAGWQAAQRAQWVKRGCTSKNRHATEAQALKAASRCASKRKGLSLRVYRCTHCSGWHLTHQER